jgi:hypothetical protein
LSGDNCSKNASNDHAGLSIESDREILVDAAMRARDHVNADQFTDAAGGSRTGVGCGLHSGDVTAHDRSHKAGADLFVTDERDVRGLNQRVSGFDHRDEAFCFNHSECFLHSDAPNRSF